MPIISRGTELGTIGEIVPGAIQSGPTTAIARVTGGGRTPVTPDIEAGSVGATFLGFDIIDKNSKGSIPVFTARTIIAWEVLFLPGYSGGIKLDIWKTTYANYETVSVANSICGGANPYIIAANKNNSTSLGAWTTSIDAGDILVFVCLSRGTPTWAQISLQTQETG